MGFGTLLRDNTYRSWWLYASIALFSTCTCAFGAATGFRVVRILGAAASSLMGSMALIAIGMWMLVQVWWARSEAAPDVLAGFRVGFNEAMFVFLAQGLMELTVGLGSGFLQLHVASVAVSAGVFSFLSLCVPRLVKLPIRKRWGRDAVLCAGVVLILLGLCL